MHQLPVADPSLLPGMREAGGEVGRQFVDVLVEFRLGFHDEREAFDFSQHFRFAATRSALRQEGAGRVWVGFHGWAFDAQDAQMQAALAVRHSAIRSRLRYIPAATDAEVRPTSTRALDLPRARRERDELLARIDETVPAMLQMHRRTAVGGAPPTRAQLPAGPRPGPGPPSASAPPPGFATHAGRRRRRFFGG